MHARRHSRPARPHARTQVLIVPNVHIVGPQRMESMKDTIVCISYISSIDLEMALKFPTATFSSGEPLGAMIQVSPPFELKAREGMN